MHSLTIPVHSLHFKYTENVRARGKRVVGNKSVTQSLLQLPLDTVFAPTNIYWLAAYAQNERKKNTYRSSCELSGIVIRIWKIGAKTMHILPHIRLTLTTSPRKRNRLLLNRQNKMKTIERVKPVSTKSAFRVWASSAHSDIFLNIPPMQFYLRTWSP